MPRRRLPALPLAAISAVAIVLAGAAAAVWMGTAQPGPGPPWHGRREPGAVRETSSSPRSRPTSPRSTGWRAGSSTRSGPSQRALTATRSRRQRPTTGSARDAGGPGAPASSPAPPPTTYTQPSEAASTPRPIEASGPATSSQSQPSGGTDSTVTPTNHAQTTAPTDSGNRPAFGANGLLGPGSSPDS